MDPVRRGLRITTGFSKSSVSGVVGAESLARESSREKRKELKAVDVDYSFEEFCYEGNKAMGQKPSGDAGTRHFVLCCFLRLEGR